MPGTDTVEGMHAEFLTAAVTSAAARLRALADRVERSAEDVTLVGTGPGRTSYAAIAADVVHEVTWGVANLSMERLVREASEADVARSKGE